MAQKLDSVSCGNAYTDAATILDIYGCQGGYFAVVGNDAFIQIQYGALGGGTQWSDEFHAPVGNGQLTAGTIGVRFRNYVAGSTSVVSAGLFYPKQPWFALSSGGNASPSAVTVVTGIIPAAGTIPTAGTGFSYTHVNGSGVYVFTFTAPTPFAATPTISLTAMTGGSPSYADATLTAASATGFSVYTVTGNSGGAPSTADQPFHFSAQPTV